MNKGKRKRQPEGDEVANPNALVDYLKSVLQNQSNDNATTLLGHLEAGPKQRTHQATEYSGIAQAAQALGIDYSYYKRAYTFALKNTSGGAKTLDPHFEYVLEKFQTSRYTQSRPAEALSRTMLDIILLDRLESLQDQHGHYLLQLNPEVNISVTIDGANDTKEIIQGRMDWALNYEATKPGSILVVWEAKRVGQATAGLPQLLIYMAGVLESRRDRLNKTVFGMLSDSGTFQFAFLDDKKKFYTSRIYTWAGDQSTILAYIDAILLDAIHSSPHTTQTKNANATIRNYRRHLKERWEFGDEPEGDAVDIDPESIVDVFNEAGVMVLRPARKKIAETNKDPEASDELEASEDPEASDDPGASDEPEAH